MTISKGCIEIYWTVTWSDPVKALAHIKGEYSQQITKCDSLDVAAERIAYALMNESGKVFVDGFGYFNETPDGFEIDPASADFYTGKVTVEIQS